MSSRAKPVTDSEKVTVTENVPAAGNASVLVSVAVGGVTSTIVPVARSVRSVTPAGRSGPVSVTVKVSAASSTPSRTVGTRTALPVSVGAKVSVPPTAV